MGSLGHIKGIIKLFIDGIAVNSCECRHTSSWYNNNGSISWTQTLGPGNHTIKVNAYITDGDGSFSGSGAFIIIRNAVSM
jgi:hypothetical protein